MLDAVGRAARRARSRSASTPARCRALLAEPLGDDLTPRRRHALRRAAARRGQAGHARAAARRAASRSSATTPRAPSSRAASCAGCARPQRVADYVAALTRHHLRLGFLVHERPLSRRAIWRYLAATEPYAADVTVFTVADRLATRGRNAEPAIAAHLELAREMLGPGARAPRRERAPRRWCAATSWPRRSGSTPGPRLGALLAALEEARYAGEIATREEAISLARSLLP